MKNRILISIALIITLSAVLMVLFEKEAPKVPVPGDANEEGAKQGQRARKQRDWAMLHDPETGKIPAGMRSREIAFAQTLPNDMEKTTSGQNFVLQGPFNVGGRTRALAIDAANENIVFAGSVSGGLYRSADAGTSWTKVTSSTQYLGVTSIVQDTRIGKTNNWYYSTGEGYGTSASGGEAFYLGDGIFKSTDGGMTWNPVSATTAGNPQTFTTNWQVVWNMATHPSTAEDAVFAATYGAIYKSSDGGDNWTAVLSSSVSGSDSYFSDVAVTTTGSVYATMSSDGQRRGIWRSSDGTAGFVNITPFNFFDGSDTLHWPAVFDRTVIGIDPNEEDVVYFFSHTPGYGLPSLDFRGDTNWVSLWKYEYLNGDGDSSGGFWTDLSMNMPYDGSALGNIVVQGSYNMLVRVMPGNSNNIFLGGTNLYCSTDGFTTNTNITQLGGYGIGSTLPFYTEYPDHHPDQHNIAFLPSNPNVMYSACDGGVYKTTDCLSDNVAWTSLNNGYYASQYYTLGIDHGTAGSSVITGGLQDWGSWWTNSSDPQATWTFPSQGDGSYCAVEDGGGTYYFSRQQGKMMKATLDANGAVTAFRRFDPIGPNKDDYQFINPFVMDPVDNNVLYLSVGEDLWRNDDLAAIPLDGAWDTISTGWSQYSFSLADTNMNITAMAVSTAGPAHRLYFGTDKKKVYKMNNANTGNPSATEITYSGMPGAGYVSAIAVDPRDADKVMVVFSNYKVYSIYYSENGGTNWKKVAGNLEQTQSGSGNGPSIRTAAILPVADGTIYLIGASTGLYATETLIADSTIWVQQGANTIGNVVVTALETRSSDGFTVIATHGNGVYTTNYTSVAEIVGVEKLNVNSLMLNVFPNPAKDNTNIVFELAESSHAELIIYNEMGRLVDKLLHKQLPMGNHSVALNTSSYRSGIYYCTLTTKKGRAGKMLVVAR